MKELKEAILKDGYGMGDNVVKVDMFLNHKLDTALLLKMGKKLHKHFKNNKVDLILTIETSGIALALATAIAFDSVPVLFAKKHKEADLNDIESKGEDYCANVYSFTHHNRNVISVKKIYLPQGCNVLIVDDFLANGEACCGLLEIIKKAGANVCGIGIGVEKGFQPGGMELRARGYDVKSLAVIKSIDGGNLVLE